MVDGFCAEYFLEKSIGQGCILARNRATHPTQLNHKMRNKNHLFLYPPAQQSEARLLNLSSQSRSACLNNGGKSLIGGNLLSAPKTITSQNTYDRAML